MRTHDAPTIDQELKTRVYVLTSAGAGEVEITDYYGRDWVLGCSIRQGIDQPIADCDVQISREEYELNMSPLHGASVINATSVLLQIGKILRVTITDSSGAHEVFRGRIDSIDWASPVINVRARDMAADLQDTWSEYPRMYAVGRIPYGVRVWQPSLTATDGEWWAPERLDDSGEAATAVYEVMVTGVFATTPPSPWPTDYDQFTNGTAELRRVVVGAENWAADTDYVWGDVVMPVDDGIERALCTMAGKSAVAEPTWPDPGEAVNELPVGATGCRWVMLPDVSDGGLALEAVMGGILRDNVGTGVPDIYAPTASGYWRNPWIMPEMSVLEALRQLTLEIGWDLRLKYIPTATNHATWGYWRLTLYEPARTSTTADATLTADDVNAVTQCAVSAAGIRNVVSVTYSEMTLGGTIQTRKTVRVTDASSIVKYGRRFMGIGEGSASGISTATEATALANAVLSDLKDPGLEFSVQSPLRWYYEINDLLEFPSTGNFVHFNAQQKLAVVAITHTLRINGSSYSAQTVIGTRGKPTAGIKAWREREQGPGRGKPAAAFAVQGAGTTTAVASVKGASIKFERPKRQPKRVGGYGQDAMGEHTQAELYMSTSTGFTPGPTNMVATSYTDRFDLAGLTTGTAQYYRIGLRDKLGNLSTITPEATFTPSQAQLLDIDDQLKVSCAAKFAATGWLTFGTDVTSAQVLFDEEIFDDGGGLVIADSEFIAPVAGVYRVHAKVVIKSYEALPDPLTYDDYMRMTGTIEPFIELKSGGSRVATGFPVFVQPGDYQGLEAHALLVLAEDADLEMWVHFNGATGPEGLLKQSVLFEVDRVWSR